MESVAKRGGEGRERGGRSGLKIEGKIFTKRKSKEKTENKTRGKQENNENKRDGKVDGREIEARWRRIG